MEKYPRFFVRETLEKNKSLTISNSRSHYISTVLRLGEGDKIVCFNGQGGEYLAQIETVDKAGVHISVSSFNGVERESPLKIRLALSALKRDKMDFAIQKATELGAESISPILTKFSSIKKQLLEKRQHHWQEIIYNACEQCGRNSPPALMPIIEFETWVLENRGNGFIFNPTQSKSLDNIRLTSNVISLIIGPEGGFESSELSLASRHNFHCISLGPRILRSETAMISAMTLVQAQWGDI